jgi:hypothetical protein
MVEGEKSVGAKYVSKLWKDALLFLGGAMIGCPLVATIGFYKAGYDTTVWAVQSLKGAKESVPDIKLQKKIQRSLKTQI